MKQSRLSNHLKIGHFVELDIQIPDHSKTGHKNRPENDHSKTGQSSIRWLTVLLFCLGFKLNLKHRKFFVAQLKSEPSIFNDYCKIKHTFERAQKHLLISSIFSPKAVFPFFVAGRALLPSVSFFDLTLEAVFLEVVALGRS
jgi:hypothetical protein